MTTKMRRQQVDSRLVELLVLGTIVVALLATSAESQEVDKDTLQDLELDYFEAEQLDRGRLDLADVVERYGRGEIRDQEDNDGDQKEISDFGNERDEDDEDLESETEQNRAAFFSRRRSRGSVRRRFFRGRLLRRRWFRRRASRRRAWFRRRSRNGANAQAIMGARHAPETKPPPTEAPFIFMQRAQPVHVENPENRQIVVHFPAQFAAESSPQPPATQRRRSRSRRGRRSRS